MYPYRRIFNCANVCMDATDARLATMRPWVLADLLRDVPCIAERLFQLRSLLSHMDVTILASQQPNLLLEVTTRGGCTVSWQISQISYQLQLESGSGHCLIA